MSDFKQMKKAITPTIEMIAELSKNEHCRRAKFLTKLARIFIEGSETGIFPTDILDPERNLNSRLEDNLQAAPSGALYGHIAYLSAQVDHFSSTIEVRTPNQEKCLLGLQTILFLFKTNRLTYGRLATLFIEVNDGEIDVEDTLIVVDMDDSCQLRVAAEGTLINLEQKEIAKAVVTDRK